MSLSGLALAAVVIAAISGDVMPSTDWNTIGTVQCSMIQCRLTARVICLIYVVYWQSVCSDAPRDNNLFPNDTRSSQLDDDDDDCYYTLSAAHNAGPTRNLISLRPLTGRVPAYVACHVDGGATAHARTFLRLTFSVRPTGRYFKLPPRWSTRAIGSRSLRNP